MKTDYAVLKKLDMVKDLDIDKWVDDSFVRQAFKEAGRDYDAELASFSNYQAHGNDPVCDAAVSDPSRAGQIWVDGADIVSFSSAACTLEGVNRYRAQGKKIDAASIRDACEAAAAEVDPQSDARGSASYKRQLVRVYVGRAIRAAFAGGAQ